MYHYIVAVTCPNRPWFVYFWRKATDGGISVQDVPTVSLLDPCMLGPHPDLPKSQTVGAASQQQLQAPRPECRFTPKKAAGDFLSPLGTGH